MKYFRKYLGDRLLTRAARIGRSVEFGRVVVLVTAAALLNADHPQWVRFQEAASRIEQAFFGTYAMPGGAIQARRPVKETVAGLSTLIQGTPGQAELYSLRALEQEQLLDFTAAETDWKKHAELATDKAAGQVELANFYYRQVRVADELKALGAAAALASPASEKLVPVQEQRSWKLFERMMQVVSRNLLEHGQRRAIYRQWSGRYPQAEGVMQNWIRAEIGAKELDQAGALIKEYGTRFPKDAEFPVSAQASIEKAKGNTAQALRVYDQAFQPLWAGQLMNEHFALLRETRQLRTFVNQARAAALKNPLALEPVARQFHFYQAENNATTAYRILLDYRRRKEAAGSWTGQELLTLARLWEPNGSERAEAARLYYALYSLPAANEEQREDALASLVHLLLQAAQPGLPLGAGDLSFYKDIATADAAPGFLNGILSLLLNSADPGYRFDAQQQSAGPYFQRAKAAELIALFEQRFPNSNRRPGLRARLIEAYGIHGDNDAVLTSGRRFLTAFPADVSRSHVSLLMADAHARKGQTKEEFVVYDALLAELSKKAEGVPLGMGVVMTEERRTAAPGSRSAEYARVLDRYVARLVALKRVKDAMVLLRRELDANPDDPGLYERLAMFLDQNKLAGEIEAVYKRAMGRFADRDWYHKLARLYLRQKQAAAFQTLTNDVVKVFSGTELERYFRRVVAQGSLDAALYKQVNLYAHQRFPHDLQFVRNLLNVYQQKTTADPVAHEALLRRYWFYDAGLRAQFFELLQRTGKLRAEVAALENNNPAATRMRAEAEAWRSHFEEAAAPMLVLAKAAPGDGVMGTRTASLYRSLAAYDGRRAQESAAIEADLVKAAPRDFGPRTRIGELSREYPKLGLNREAWNGIATLEPGVSDGYLEAATLHWDYFEFDAALKQIDAGRSKLQNAALFAYEAGAIYENQRRYDKAIAEYVKGSLAEPGGSMAQQRLMQLSVRPAHRQTIDAATATLAGGVNPENAAISLRIALLEGQQRKADLEAYLMNLAAQGRNVELVARMELEGVRFAYPKVEERAITRQMEMAEDPVDKLRLRIQLARFYERRADLPAAARTIDAVQRENPLVLGILRTAVNYHWRNKNTARAVELLTTAANAAHAGLKPQLQFEAARKATEAGQAATARQLLSGLIAGQPYNASYLGAMADTYAKERDDRGLRAFYQEKIELIGKAPLPALEKMERVAAMRRALIPVLVRANDATAAIDQYIEVINRYPEDEQLLGEAAGFARRNKLEARLAGYYEKAAAASPKDFRFPLVLARIDTHLEEYPAAIAMFEKAALIRPDRLDLWSSKGTLEERLLRFEDAAATFTKVYDLSYRNSVWMERVAEIRARQGKNEDAVAALRKAYLEVNPDAAQAQFEVARRLDEWGMTAQALPFAERGVALAGARLLEGFSDGAQTYARIMTRLRRYAAAHAKGPKGELLMTMAAVVKAEFNAQEKAQFVAFLDRVKNVATPDVGRAAGLAAWEARRTFELLMANVGQADSQMYLDRLRQFQHSRLQFAELGTQLESYAKAHADLDAKEANLNLAAEEFRKAGDDVAEMRVLAQQRSRSPRYLELLARRSPDELIPLATDGAVNAAIASGKADVAMAALRARGRNLTPVWNRAYLGLTGLYFGLQTPEINGAFEQALGPMTIGQRIAKPADRREVITGNVWYYFGARYGEYLDLLKKPEFDEFLPAMVEAMPGNAGAYWQMGEYYRESGRIAQAIAAYELALQLQPAHASSLERLARVEWAQGKQDAARLRWKQALDAMETQMSGSRVSGNVNRDLAVLLEAIVEAKQLDGMRADVERVAVRYVQRFGSFQSEPILKHFDAAWLAAISRRAPNAVDFLTPIVDSDWMAQAAKEPLFERLLEELATKVATAVGEGRDMALNDQANWTGRWIEYLLERKQSARARSVMGGLGEEMRRRLQYLTTSIDARLAAQEGRLEAYLTAYQGDVYPIREVAMRLKDSDAAASRRLLRYFYERQMDRGELTAGNFLGLAEVRLEEGDTAEAVSQLKRMTLVTQPAFAYLKDAGLLLRRFQKESEAAVFLAQAVQSTPWDADAKLAQQPPKPAVARTVAQLEVAVRDNPQDQKLKLELFKAARPLGRNRQAVNALEAAGGNSIRMVFEEDSGGEGDVQVNRYWLESFLAEFNLSRAERAGYARELADSLFRIERVQGALLARELAEKLVPAEQGPARLAVYRAELVRRRTNLDRRPFVGEQIEQDKRVRPMIAAGGVR